MGLAPGMENEVGCPIRLFPRPIRFGVAPLQHGAQVGVLVRVARNGRLGSIRGLGEGKPAHVATPERSSKVCPWAEMRHHGWLPEKWVMTVMERRLKRQRDRRFHASDEKLFTDGPGEPLWEQA